MNTKIYDNIPSEARAIRQTVFMEEQGFQEEFDEIDNIAKHLVMFNDKDEEIATCRVFWDENMQSYILGRLAVVKAYRGKNLGATIIEEAEEYIKSINGNALALHAQYRVKAFYEKSGYREFDEIDDDEGCPHIWMKKLLKD